MAIPDFTNISQKIEKEKRPFLEPSAIVECLKEEIRNDIMEKLEKIESEEEFTIAEVGDIIYEVALTRTEKLLKDSFRDLKKYYEYKEDFINATSDMVGFSSMNAPCAPPESLAAPGSEYDNLIKNEFKKMSKELEIFDGLDF